MTISVTICDRIILVAKWLFSSSGRCEKNC